jgi:hypothetical protein
MQRTIGVLAVVAVLGIVGVPVAALAGSSEPIWSTDTVMPEQPMKKADACPKAKPYDGPVWSTDAVEASPCGTMSASSPSKKAGKKDGMMKEAPKKSSMVPCSKAKPYDGPVWSTDTVDAMSCEKEKMAASAPKGKPYDGPVWSTDPR